MKNEKFLPIGTVVMLKGGKKRLMITGFCMIDKKNSAKMFDYSGCLYPEGVVSTDQTALFDHEQIEKIYFVGYSDQEENTFKTQLKTALANQKSTSVTNSSQDDTANIPPIGPGL